VILIIYFAGSYLAFGQHCYGENLIPNPSLDSFSICPDNVWQIDRAVPWTQPLWQSASGAYHQCMFDGHPTQMDTINWRKVHWRTLGLAYLIIWEDWGSPPWRTYIEVPLKRQLEAGQCYYGEFWVLTHNVSKVGIDAIGMYFSDTLVKIKYDTIIGGDTIGFIKPIYANPQIANPTGHILRDTAHWEKVSGTFIATGTETAMIMGCFKHDNEVNYEQITGTPGQSARYFFDDFVLCKCEDTITPAGPEQEVFIPNIFSPNGDRQNDVFMVRGENITELNLSVYNRWGNKVFEGSGPQTAWDGTYNGKTCAGGVFYYMAEIGFVGGKREMRKGNVTLVR
ncbi:MAG TPA: gliding motility-associated C-terminal domain-containing protein, partial [Bacteroidales bacterium]|nr:gliding motility-associated C-terminal domain-containing protein [Bacteroidales bacterium]